MKRILLLSLLTLLLTGCALSRSNIAEHDPLDDFGPMLAAAAEERNILLLCGDTDWPELPPHAVPFAGDDLWERVRAGFRFDLDQDNPRISAQRAWFVRNPQYIERVTTRAQRYLFHIVEQAEQKNVPMEMALLPIVESAFDPFAYSHGRASGPWQFIPSTGKAFGMEQHYWYDGRRDILQSTEAALTYLDRLATRFGDDWELALASYNAGGGTVSRAITRNRNRNRPLDYWNLDLPRETRDYVPKLIALSQIVRDPQKYGLTLTPIANALYFEVVDIEGQLDLKLAAEMAQTDVNEIYYLNAGFSQWATPPNGPHRILVPVSQADIFRKALAELPPEQRLRWQEYTIRPGDTLGGIARQHNTNIEALREANRLRGNTIVAGRTLLIPQPSAAADSYRLSADNRLQARQNQNPAGRSRTDYTVRSGDSLWTIARRHNVTVRELAHWNGMAPGDTLAAGRQLVIWTQGPAAAPTADRPEMIRRVNYAVRRGDSLHAIANRFNVSVTEIARWNNLNTSRHLQPGQRLTLFVDVRNAP